MGTYIPLIANTLTSSKAPDIVQVNNNSPSVQSGQLNHDSLTGLFCTRLLQIKVAGVSIPQSEEEEEKWEGNDRKLELGEPTVKQISSLNNKLASLKDTLV